MSELEMDEFIAEKCQETLDAILDALPNDLRPSRAIALVPGESVVWDSCCEGGQLTVRVASMAPRRTGAKTALLTPCTIDYWTVTVEVMLLRCAAVVDNQGLAPSAEALTNDGTRGLSDMALILRTITQLPFVDDVTAWTPQGPSGGCFGNRWNFTFKADATPCGPTP